MAWQEYLKETVILGNSLYDYGIAFIFTTLIYASLYLIKGYLKKFLIKFTAKSKNKFDDLVVQLITSFGPFFVLIVSLFVGMQYLLLPEIVHTITQAILIIVVVAYVIKAFHKLIDFFAKRIASKSDTDESLVTLLSVLAKLALWIIAILMVLANLGINITSLLAGVGIGGIAIAFALQSILEDIFSSFSIYFDKPFRKGDFIIIGSDMGVIKKIGLKTTRIQALQGQEIVVSNKELTSTRIHNYKKMKERRVAFTFGVEYNTSTPKVKKIPDMVKKILSKLENIRVDRVHFKEFGPSALIFEVVYYLDSSDYNIYMDRQQAMNIGMKQAFEKEKIEFAFPTTTVYVRK